MVQKPLEPDSLPITRLAERRGDQDQIRHRGLPVRVRPQRREPRQARQGPAPNRRSAGPEARGHRRGATRTSSGHNDNQRTRRTRTSSETTTTTRRRDGQDTKRADQVGQRETAAGPAAAGRGVDDYQNFSPDRKNFVFAKKLNLYFAEAGKEDAGRRALDRRRRGLRFGAGGFGRGGGGRGGNGRQRQRQCATPRPSTPTAKLRAAVTWSTDSKAFYVTRSDSRGVKELFVINSLATPRPTLEKYKYPLPGEEEIRKTELYVYSRDQEAHPGHPEVEGRELHQHPLGQDVRRAPLRPPRPAGPAPRILHARTSPPARRSA